MDGLNNNNNIFDGIEQNDPFANDVPAGLELTDNMDIEVDDDVFAALMNEPVNTRPLVLNAPAQIPPPLESLTLDKAIEHELQFNLGSDSNVDLKKLRRTVSNRLSAKRSRNRKNNHIETMEKNIHELQKVIANLAKEIQDCEKNKKLLVEENASLQALLERRTQEAELADGKIASCKEEIRWLKGLQKNVIDNDDDDIGQYINWDELTNGSDDHATDGTA